VTLLTRRDLQMQRTNGGRVKVEDLSRKGEQAALEAVQLVISECASHQGIDGIHRPVQRVRSNCSAHALSIAMLCVLFGRGG